MNTFMCACHGNRWTPCDYPGGCGSSGGCCARAGTCTTCPAIRPDSAPRQPHTPPVCDGDRTLLDRWLGEINRLHEQLAEPEPPIVNQRTYERYGVEYLKGNRREVISLGAAWADPLAALGGVSPINSRRGGPSVTGSRERPMPISADRHDLTGGARGTNLTVAGRQHPDDHVGHISTATVLDGWVRSWRDTLWPGHHLPGGSVPELVKWLRVRLGDACDRYPVIGEFAGEIKALRGTLRALAGESETPPQPCDGVQCGHCDTRALFRRLEDTYRAECGSCGNLYTADEYDTLIKGQADFEKFVRGPEEIAGLMRR